MSITWAFTDSGYILGKAGGEFSLIPCRPVKISLYREILFKGGEGQF